jgi:spore germination cell wall hydrolase CwlJ-like protein
LKTIHSIKCGAALFVFGACILLLGATEGLNQRPAAPWAQQRLDTIDTALGVPLPSTYEELLEFAQVPDRDDKQQYCLAQAVYFEARGEPAEGQVAVARVIMNRVEDTRYPSTICGVVFQRHSVKDLCQFEFACDAHSDRPYEKAAWKMANRIAYMVRENWLPDPVGDAQYFHAAALAKPGWARRMVQIAHVGNHIFYSDSTLD